MKSKLQLFLLSLLLISPAFANDNWPILTNITGKTLQEVKIPKAEIEADFTFDRKFSEEDIKLAELAVGFIENLIGEKIETNFNNFYWSDDILDANYLGMTVYYERLEYRKAFVAISSEANPKDIKNLNELKRFGSLLVHELNHAKNLHSERVTQFKVDRVVNLLFDLYLHASPEDIFDYVPESYENYETMLEKIAHTSGIEGPWQYECENQNEVIIQLVPIQPPPDDE